MKIKILIIKLGYSETLDPEISRVPSLGDVLRSTPVLRALKEKYPDSHITWLVSEEAEPLLFNNTFIDKILTWDEFVPFQIMKEKFDILINLEKIPGVCALADMADAWTKYGFRFDTVEGDYQAYEKGMSFIDYLKEKQANGKPKDVWQKVLIEMLGAQWKEQEYVIGYQPKTVETYDVGLNYEVGSKWPTKAMSIEQWKKLEFRLLEEGFTVSWQKGLKNLFEYMDWIHSCRIIVTQDSLGLHIAFAFKKKILGIFGPTDPKEAYFYGRGKSVFSFQKCERMPCYSPTCKTKLECMKSIDIESAVRELKELRHTR